MKKNVDKSLLCKIFILFYYIIKSKFFKFKKLLNIFKLIKCSL